MGDLVLSRIVGTQLAVARRSESILQSPRIRQDRVLILVIIAVALVIAAGVLTAWWITCQNKGMYPALDTAPWNAGGTWKAYCAK